MQADPLPKPCHSKSHRIGGNRRRSLQSMNADQKSLEAVFLIAICRQLGDKWQLKTPFLTIFYLHSSIVLMFSIVAYPVCKYFLNFPPTAKVIQGQGHGLKFHPSDQAPRKECVLENYFSLFLIQDRCCGYSKELSQNTCLN